MGGLKRFVVGAILAMLLGPSLQTLAVVGHLLVDSQHSEANRDVELQTARHGHDHAATMPDHDHGIAQPSPLRLGPKPVPLPGAIALDLPEPGVSATPTIPAAFRRGPSCGADPPHPRRLSVLRI